MEGKKDRRSASFVDDGVAAAAVVVVVLAAPALQTIVGNAQVPTYRAEEFQLAGSNPAGCQEIFKSIQSAVAPVA